MYGRGHKNTRQKPTPRTAASRRGRGGGVDGGGESSVSESRSSRFRNLSSLHADRFLSCLFTFLSTPGIRAVNPHGRNLQLGTTGEVN